MKKDILNDNQLNRKISIFHIEHFGGIAQAITLRTRLHPDDYAILVVGDYGARQGISNRLVEIGIFDKLIYYKIDHFLRMDDEDALEEKICQFFDAEFKDINFDDINKIYTHCDLTNTFEIYLSIKKLKYYLYDAAVITLDKEKIGRALYWKTCSNKYDFLINKYKTLCGFSDSCVGYMIFKESKINAYIDSSKVIVYDFNKEIKLIDEKFKEKIITAFEVDKIEDDSQLILTNSKGFLLASGLSINKLPVLVQYMLDFTADIYKPIIKPHPYDPINYDEAFADIPILNKYYPTELLNITHNLEKLSKTVSINTTAIDFLDLDDSCKICEWSAAYYKYFKYLPILYTVADLIVSVSKSSYYHHKVDYIDFLKRFYKFSKYHINEINDASAKIIGNVILFVDSSDDYVKNNIKIGLESARNNGIVCFLNMKTQLTDYDIPINRLNEIIPFKINVDADEGSLDTSREHTVYFFTKNPEIRKEIQSFSMSEYFKYSKTKVTVDPNSNLQNQIDFLKLIIGNFI